MTAKKLVEIGSLARDEGITLCLHPHYGTNVERYDEIQFMMNQTNPDLLSLCLDTAHTVLGYMDPVDTFRRYISRLSYVHLKDIVPVEGSWSDGFRELGEGNVDFQGVVEVLKSSGYNGIICVELDNPRESNIKSAGISRHFLRDHFGL